MEILTKQLTKQEKKLTAQYYIDTKLMPKGIYIRTKFWARTSKICRFCRKDNIPVHKNSKVNGRTYYACNECERDKKRKWYRQPMNKLKQKEYNKKYLNGLSLY